MCCCWWSRAVFVQDEGLKKENVCYLMLMSFLILYRKNRELICLFVTLFCVFFVAKQRFEIYFYGVEIDLSWMKFEISFFIKWFVISKNHTYITVTYTHNFGYIDCWWDVLTSQCFCLWWSTRSFDKKAINCFLLFFVYLFIL